MPATPLGETVTRTLAVVQRLRGLSDGQLAAAAGMTSRQQVEQRRRGVTSITVDDLHRLSTALDVPPAVLLMDPAEAVAWIAQHAPASITGTEAATRVTTSPTHWYPMRPWAWAGSTIRGKRSRFRPECRSDTDGSLHGNLSFPLGG